MEKNIKGKVKAYYGNIAKKVSSNSHTTCGCGTACCGEIANSSNIYTKEYLEGLPDDVTNASLGCANIEEIAKQKNLGDVYSQIDEELLDGAYAGAHVKAYK